MARRKTAATPEPAASAAIIPFPAYRQAENASVNKLRDNPDFNAGFEFAMALVKSLKARRALTF